VLKNGASRDHVALALPFYRENAKSPLTNARELT
jgi:hypothetical protein